MNIDIYNGFPHSISGGLSFRGPDTSSSLTSLCSGIEGESGQSTVYLQGAHLTHWKPEGGKPVLFTSEQALFQPGVAIRGGVPIIFPWFGAHPENSDAPSHGFARVKTWQPVSFASDGINTSYKFHLRHTPEDNPHWSHHCRLGYSIDLTRDTLFLCLSIELDEDKPVPFEAALHTYFAVEDVRQVEIEGFDGTSYLDQLTGKTEVQAGTVRFTEETDRIYSDTGTDFVIRDVAGGREIWVSTDAPSAVVWNPWTEKALRLKDFGDDEWPKMVCLESGFIGKGNFQLLPRQTVELRVGYRVRPLHGK